MASGKQSSFDLLWGNSEPLSLGFNLDNMRNSGVYSAIQAKGAPIDDIDYTVVIYNSITTSKKRSTVQIAYSTGGTTNSRVHSPDGGWSPWVSLGPGGGGGSGTVTSVQGSGGSTGLAFTGGPVTTTGTLTLSGILSVASGGTGAGTALAARVGLGLEIGSDVHPFSGFLDDFEFLSFANGDLLYSDGASVARLPAGTVGQILQTNGAAAPTWRNENTGGAGTVTSLGISGGTTGLTTSGGPITTSGVITLSGILSVTNGGTGAGTALAARASLGLVLGTNVQAQNAILQNLSTSFAQGDVLYYNGTNMVPLTAGILGRVLTTQGPGANPIWTAVSGGGAVDGNVNTVQINRDTAANLALANAVATVGEPIMETDTFLRKTGDGTEAYNDIPYDGTIMDHDGSLTFERSGKDVNSIFVTLTWKRSDGTKYRESILSGGTSPEYTTRTVTYYKANGTATLRTQAYTLAYASGDLTSETLV